MFITHFYSVKYLLLRKTQTKCYAVASCLCFEFDVDSFDIFVPIMRMVVVLQVQMKTSVVHLLC